MGSFADSIKKNIAEVKQEVNTKINKLFVFVGEGIVFRGPSSYLRGPYSDGLFTNQWYPQLGSGYSSSLTSQKSHEGLGSITRIREIALESKEFLGKDGSITLTNNVWYGPRIEYLGWPKDTPGYRWKGAGAYHMVSFTLQDVAAKNK